MFYSYVGNVNRVFSNDSSMGNIHGNLHLVNVGYDMQGLGRATAYWYYYDLDEQQTFSSSTLGARLKGDFEVNQEVGLDYAAEFAHQSDVGDNPDNVDEIYALGELGVERGGFKLSAGYELLGGSGDTGDSFKTPFATLWKFNGWADLFLVTPDNGLRDAYVTLQAAVNGQTTLQATYHDFNSDHGSDDYGSEVDLGVTYQVSKPILVGARYANYMADDFSDDVQKAWFWISIKP